jgi:adenylosuccinate synthase
VSLANVVVIGAQWGDEGKGKITDLLSRSADVVVRYQGGVNAGHTIVVDDKVLKLHLIPSGILYPDTICLIGSGTVVDPKVMLGELDMLATYSIDISGLKLASTAHVTMPYHRLLDQAAPLAEASVPPTQINRSAMASASWTFLMRIGCGTASPAPLPKRTKFW